MCFENRNLRRNEMNIFSRRTTFIIECLISSHHYLLEEQLLLFCVQKRTPKFGGPVVQNLEVKNLLKRVIYISAKLFFHHKPTDYKNDINNHGYLMSRK